MKPIGLYERPYLPDRPFLGVRLVPALEVWFQLPFGVGRLLLLDVQERSVRSGNGVAAASLVPVELGGSATGLSVTDECHNVYLR